MLVPNVLVCVGVQGNRPELNNTLRFPIRNYEFLVLPPARRMRHRATISTLNRFAVMPFLSLLYHSTMFVATYKHTSSSHICK